MKSLHFPLLNTLVIPFIFVTFCNCGTEIRSSIPGCTSMAASNYDELATADNGSCVFELLSCDDCDYVVEEGQFKIDGAELGLQGGDVIGLNGDVTYSNLLFENLIGTEGNPITIINCNGKVLIDVPDRTYGLLVKNSKHFRVTGTGFAGSTHGIEIANSLKQGLYVSYLCSNFEVDHTEVHHVGFAGIMAKTDPTCDEETHRGNFTMYDIKIHDNYVHHTEGEGFYIGSSFYDKGANTPCGKKPPHDIVGARVYNNVIHDTGAEGLQVGSAPVDVEIFNNSITNYGQDPFQAFQNNGLQIGGGTGGLCYNNKVIDGPAVGIIVIGIGDNSIFNNVIINPGTVGVFSDEREETLLDKGIRIMNNTIINPGEDGIRIYSENLQYNECYNNIIINPGNFDSYESDPTWRKGEHAYVITLQQNQPNLTMSNNFFSRNIEDVKFVNHSENNLELSPGSPAIDEGKDIETLGVIFDIIGRERPNGTGFDIGAYESQ